MISVVVRGCPLLVTLSVRKTGITAMGVLAVGGVYPLIFMGSGNGSFFGFKGGVVVIYRIWISVFAQVYLGVYWLMLFV